MIRPRTWCAARALALAVVLSPIATHAMEAELGRALFNRAWTPAPSSTRANDGLGPLFGARSCLACHPGADRPDFSRQAEPPRGMIARISNAKGAGDPVYGRQIQDEAVNGLAPEARLRLSYAVDGAPIPRLSRFAYGPLAKGVRVSLRLAPPVHGLAAIENVIDDAIRAGADPEDRDGDGVRGRVAEVEGAVGRYGFKAGRAGLRAQIADAFSTDMGMSSALRPAHAGDCTARQRDCLTAPQGAPDSAGPYEIADPVLDAIRDYLISLPQRGREPEGEAAGRAVFVRLGCAACHRPQLAGKAGPSRLYSDLLLHDMGEGLSSLTAEGSAGAREWRTAPLVGLGAQLAAGKPLLHDGRARDISAALTWHDGEASAARRRYEALPSDAKAALMDFLRIL